MQRIGRRAVRIFASRRVRRHGAGGIQLRGWDRRSLGGVGLEGKALLRLGGGWPGEEALVVVGRLGSGRTWFAW